MNNICQYCLNYESKKKNQEHKNRETCLNQSFVMSANENEMICENFMLVISPNVSSAVVERFLRKDINFYDNLCDLASIILTMFSYQTIFKIVFDIEHGLVELIDMTNSSNSYGTFMIESIQLTKGCVSFKSDSDFVQLVLGVIEPESLIFVEFKDFDYKYPIKGTFAKPHRFFNKNELSLFIQSFDGQEVW